MYVNLQVPTEEHLPGFQLQLGVCERFESRSQLKLGVCWTSKRRRFLHYHRQKEINNRFKLNLQINQHRRKRLVPHYLEYKESSNDRCNQANSFRTFPTR